MTLTQTLYARRHGNMMFWRMGRLGGSMYLASRTPAETREAREARREAKRERMASLRDRARWGDYWRRAYLIETTGKLA